MIQINFWHLKGNLLNSQIKNINLWHFREYQIMLFWIILAPKGHIWVEVLHTYVWEPSVPSSQIDRSGTGVSESLTLSRMGYFYQQNGWGAYRPLILFGHQKLLTQPLWVYHTPLISYGVKNRLKTRKTDKYRMTGVRRVDSIFEYSCSLTDWITISQTMLPQYNCHKTEQYNNCHWTVTQRHLPCKSVSQNCLVF